MTRRYHWISRSWSHSQKEVAVILAIVGVLLVLWVIGMVTGLMFGGLIHLMLVAAVVTFVIGRGRGENPLRRG